MPDLSLAVGDGVTTTESTAAVQPPFRMSHSTFPFAANFPGLSNSTIDFACTVVENEWSGIFEFWATLPDDVRAQKQYICEAYLVGWWLADMYPTNVSGIQADGGMPLTAKSIGGVSVSRKDLEAQPALKQLESNAYGVKALEMIMSSPERMGLIGRQWSLGPAMRGGWAPGW